MSSIQTPFTRLLGIEASIVQAPIGSATTPELVAAVSNAGGPGMLSITWRTLNEARSLIRETKSLTDKPFGVNLVLHWDPKGQTIAYRADGSPVLRYEDDFPLPGVTGDLESMVQYAGQGVGLLNETLPAAKIVQNLVEETHAALRRLDMMIAE